MSSNRSTRVSGQPGTMFARMENTHFQSFIHLFGPSSWSSFIGDKLITISFNHLLLVHLFVVLSRCIFPSPSALEHERTCSSFIHSQAAAAKAQSKNNQPSWKRIQAHEAGMNKVPFQVGRVLVVVVCPLALLGYNVNQTFSPLFDSSSSSSLYKVRRRRQRQRCCRSSCCCW